MVETGKTLTTAGEICYEYGVGSRNATLINMSYQRGITQKNKNEYIIRPLNSLPPYLKFHSTVYRKVKSVEIETYEDEAAETDADVNYNKKLKNTLRSIVPGQTETKASTTGRGYKARFILIDEINFFKFIQIVLTATLSAQNMAAIEAENQGLRHNILFASTPGDLTKLHGKYMYNKIYNEFLGFDLRFLDCDRKQLNRLLMQKRTNFFRIKFSYAELGFGAKYLQTQIQKLGMTDALRTEILLEWVMDTTTSPFSRQELDRLNKVKDTIITDSYIFKNNKVIQFHPYFRGQSFEDMIRMTPAMSIGVDTASGVRNENSAIFACSLIDGRPLFSFKDNTINTWDFGHMVKELFKDIRRTNANCLPLLVVERNGIGKSVCDACMSDPAVEPFLIVEIVKSKDGYEKWSEKTLRDNRKANYGVYINKDYRSYLTDQVLKEVVEKYPSLCRDPQLIDEIITLIKKPTSSGTKIVHTDGCTDDVVFAAMHAWSVIFRPEFRDDILKNVFGFYLDFTKIKCEPLGPTVSIYSELGEKEDLSNKIFEDVEFITDDTNQIIPVKFYYKMINGRKVKLSNKESNEYEKNHTDYVKETAVANKKRAIEKRKEVNNNTDLFHNHFSSLQSVDPFTQTVDNIMKDDINEEENAENMVDDMLQDFFGGGFKI